jgi:hypothetical protein
VLLARQPFEESVVLFQAPQEFASRRSDELIVRGFRKLPQGDIPRGDRIVDAAVVRAPTWHLKAGEKAQPDESGVPETRKRRKRQPEDVKARCTKKHARKRGQQSLRGRVFSPTVHGARHGLVKSARRTSF